MSKKEAKINIVGAGVSGLVAAKVLENKGYHPVVFEKSDRVGGRMKTDIVEGVPLDRGFQVLLEAYPAAKEHLDFDALDLQCFHSGSTIFDQSSPKLFGDPLRDIMFLFPTLFSKHAKFSDKLNVYRLTQELKRVSVEEIFSREETTTIDYLSKKGFSDKIIQQFFQPFFSGIFLETKLETSSRMFEFVFKMFSEGKALIPKKGIEEIPKQLKESLCQTTFHFNVTIAEVNHQGLIVEGLPLVESDFTIIATEADQLIPNLRDQKIDWRACFCLYFEVENKVIQKALIGLIPGNHLINNLHYVDAILGTSATGKPILSVTIVDTKQLNEEELIPMVIQELREHCGIEVIRHLRSYFIKKALPNLHQLAYTIPASQTQLLNRVFLAGDVMLNGSLNAAIISGEKAAEAILEKLGEIQ